MPAIFGVYINILTSGWEIINLHGPTIFSIILTFPKEMHVYIEQKYKFMENVYFPQF